MKIAIDFGITNTDLVIKKNKKTIYQTFPSIRKPTTKFVKKILKKVDKKEIEYFVFTGGHHYLFKNKNYNKIPIIHVNEINAIGSGGIFLTRKFKLKSALIVSAGTGTACVYANKKTFKHITGTSLGGGTLLGLSKLLLNIVDPNKIDKLACKGSSKSTDFILKEVVSGKIGNLNPNSTAINFGKISFNKKKLKKKDIASGLMSLLAQSITRSTLHALAICEAKDVVFIGRTINLKSLRKLIIDNLKNQNLNIIFPQNSGYATACGALSESERLINKY